METKPNTIATIASVWELHGHAHQQDVKFSTRKCINISNKNLIAFSLTFFIIPIGYLDPP